MLFFHELILFLANIIIKIAIENVIKPDYRIRCLAQDIAQWVLFVRDEKKSYLR